MMEETKFDPPLHLKKGDRIGMVISNQPIEAARRNTGRTARWNSQRGCWEVVIATKTPGIAIVVDQKQPD